MESRRKNPIQTGCWRRRILVHISYSLGTEENKAMLTPIFESELNIFVCFAFFHFVGPHIVCSKNGRHYPISRDSNDDKVHKNVILCTRQETKKKAAGWCVHCDGETFDTSVMRRITAVYFYTLKDVYIIRRYIYVYRYCIRYLVSLAFCVLQSLAWRRRYVLGMV